MIVSRLILSVLIVAAASIFFEGGAREADDPNPDDTRRQQHWRDRLKAVQTITQDDGSTQSARAQDRAPQDDPPGGAES
ncbi:hypothetical protein [Microvirga pudoricolor]|uniref:hypothetical protein n=1 Tax=Microvirga pudoricolor TaxID=2778729 RepID=UPI001950D680|nr:hypothetical protein [Microvirga pudoricolor]MBM6594173.1 hypothetical protein [Microvirga pudoricolor]